jgi:hypothetical protein
LYWADSRNAPGSMQTLASGTFDRDVGTFYAPDTFDGKPITVRVIWQRKDDANVYWEQGFSPDNGKTWETNWIMDFRRAHPTDDGRTLPYDGALEVQGLRLSLF